MVLLFCKANRFKNIGRYSYSNFIFKIILSLVKTLQSESDHKANLNKILRERDILPLALSHTLIFFFISISLVVQPIKTGCLMARSVGFLIIGNLKTPTNTVS